MTQIVLASSDPQAIAASAITAKPVTINFEDNRLLPELYGGHQRHIVLIEQGLGVKIRC